MHCMCIYISVQSERTIILQCFEFIQWFLLVSMIPLYTLEWPQGLKELDALFLLLLTCSHEGHITAR